MKHTLIEKFAVAGGFRTRFLEAGSADARPVVLLHDGGFGGAAETSWGAVAPGLAEAGYRVLIPDMLGFGGTDKVFFFDRSPVAFRIKHIGNFCTALGLPAAHFAGNSFGGTMIMRALAVTPLPWPFASACSIAGTGGPWRVPEAMAKLADFDGSIGAIERLVSFMADPDHEGFDYQGYVQQRHTRSLTPGHFGALAAARLQPPWEEGRQSAEADTYPGSLKGCQVPLLLVEGADDPTCQPGWPARIQEVLPSAKVEKVAGRHSPNVERPQEVTSMLLRWFQHVEGK